MYGWSHVSSLAQRNFLLLVRKFSSIHFPLSFWNSLLNVHWGFFLSLVFLSFHLFYLITWDIWVLCLLFLHSEGTLSLVLQITNSVCNDICSILFTLLLEIFLMFLLLKTRFCSRHPPFHSSLFWLQVRWQRPPVKVMGCRFSRGMGCLGASVG